MEDEEIGSDDLFHERLIRIFRPQIESEIIPSHVIFYLENKKDVASEIFKLERESHREAINLLLEKLLEKPLCKGWFTAFVDALNSADFKNLAKRLSCQKFKDDKSFRLLVTRCLPVLEDIDPMPIMPHLAQSNAISQEDLTEVTKLANQDRRSAMLDLVGRLPLLRENWLELFVDALKANDETKVLHDLGQLIETARLNENESRTGLEVTTVNDLESDLAILKRLLPDGADDESKELNQSSSSATAGNSSPGEQHKTRQPESEEAPPVGLNLLSNSPGKHVTDEKMSNIVTRKPLGVAARIESQSRQDDLPVRNIPVQEVTSSADHLLETCPKQAFSGSSATGETSLKVTYELPSNFVQALQNTMPKTIDDGWDSSSSGRTRVYPPDDHAQSSGASCSRTQEHRCEYNEDTSCFSFHSTVSCADNNCPNLHMEETIDEAASSSNAGNRDTRPTGFETLVLDEPTTTSLSHSAETTLVPNQVFVSNLPENATKEEIIEHFGMIGDIQLNSKGDPLVHLYRDKQTGRPKGEALITYANDIYANAAVDIFNETDFEDNIIKVEIAYRKLRNSPSKEPSSTPSRLVLPADEDNSGRTLRADSSFVPPGEGVHGELELRSYQEELAAKAKQGHNCIIVAPTGSGKTHVAMEIVRNHIEWKKNLGEDPKIVFFVPTVALVEQQRRQFERYLKDCSILGLSGDQDAKLPLSELVPKKDIIVLTPQILENGLKDDLDTLAIFSLMIYDECHHTSKSHPYNMIMSHYIDEKLDRGRLPNFRLPQVVGLTASVGVGKSKTMEQAVTCILKLCANMDATEICTVKEHLEELENHVNKPNEGTKEISGRREDPFFKTINDIMVLIENEMKKPKRTERAATENGEFLTLMQAPAERGGDRYTQWISRLQKLVDALCDQPSRRFYVACLKDLGIYNTALLINADCRTKDALDYTVKEFNPAQVDNLNEFCDHTDEWLKRLFHEKEPYLTMVSQDPKFENPKLNYLKDLICEEYRKEPGSRGIIFCKTREMTVALVNWMKDTPELKVLRPHHLVGTNAPSNKAGMTQVKQDDVLVHFKRGEHRLIVATSVAEEGLDVQQCNIVIRYEHVTNQIARVQSRGRARAENAQYLVVAEKGRGAVQKEEANKIREKMMQKAINIIGQMRIQDKERQINDYQREAQVERDMARKGKEISKLLKASTCTNSVYSLRCRKCDSFTTYSDDIRKIEKSHHVILDQEYRSRIVIRPHPAPRKFENFEMTGKIFCKRCHFDWGIMALYKKVPFPVVKVCSFIVVAKDESRKVYRKWKEVPFTVQSLTPTDLENMVQASSSEIDTISEGDHSIDSNCEDEEDLSMYD